ncbi:hypothetical protein ACRRTK_019812 [Alexandromys fortis]
MSYTEDPTVRHPGPLKGCATDVFAGERHNTDHSSLRFHQLWITVVASICCKGKLL